MFNNILLMGAASATGAGKFDVDYSCLFNDDDTPRLYRTPTVVGNRRTGSISLWYKRGNMGSIMQLFNAGAGDDITFDASDKLTFIDSSGVSYITTQVFRDTSAWGNLLFAWDTTLAAAGDRLRIYHNGVEITAFDTETNPAQNDLFEISNIVRQTVGAGESDGQIFDGYFSQYYYVDGQQLTPSSFGEFTSTNIWRPILYSGGGSGTGGNTIPKMTSNTLPSGTAAASSIYDAARPAWKAFSQVVEAEGWLSGSGLPQWISYDFGVGVTKTPIQYSIKTPTSATDRSLNSWTLEASNTGAFAGEETTLDTRSGETGWSAGETRVFDFSNTTAFRYFRINVTVNNNVTDAFTSIDEIELMETSSGYGTNGFYFDFADSSDFGNDVSGLGNDYTSSGLTATDQVVDTPTNNFCTLARPDGATTLVYSEGMLKVSSTATGWRTGQISMKIPNTGKWVYKVVPTGGVVSMTGVMGTNATQTPSGHEYPYIRPFGANYAISHGWYNYCSSYIGYGELTLNINASTTWQAGVGNLAAGDVLEVYLDNDANTIKYYKNGVQIGATGTGINIMDWAFYSLYYGSQDLTFDFGQHGFTRTDDTYNYLCTANIPIPAITDGTSNFQTTLYTGDGSVRNIDQTGNSTFQPDLVWIKNRSAADPQNVIDAARGVTKEFLMNADAIESTNANGLTSFDSDGFGLGTGADGYNDNTENFVAWQWLAGGGAGSSNEDGSINTITTTVNTTAGISISTYTGTGANATVGHGLGIIPKFIIVKNMDVSQPGVAYHAAQATAADPGDYYLHMTITAAPTDHYSMWNDTVPTSTVFSLGTSVYSNQSSQTMLAYCFAEVEGFSRFSMYCGNGLAYGNQVSVGFKPAFLMIKKASSTGNWLMYDRQRSPYNEVDDQLITNTAAAETTGSEGIDFLATGFRPRATESDINSSLGLYIFAAFAEHPLGGGEDVTPATVV